MAALDTRELRVALDRAKAPVAFEILDGLRTELPLANISRSGMFLENPSGLNIVQGHSLHFALHLDQYAEEVTGVAKVRWVRGRDLGPYQPRGIGVQVVEFHDNAERKYLEFLESCLLNLKITDLMEPMFATLPREATVAEAARQLSQHDVDCLIVVDQAGTAVGVFNRSDLARACLIQDFLAAPVGVCMQQTFHALTTDHGADDAYTIMRKGKSTHVPVLEDGICVGVLAIRDLMRYWGEYMDLQAKRLAKNYERAMSVIAHDLRTPIGLIQTTNAMLTSGEVSPQEYIASGFPESLDASCEMMLRLIDDILDLQSLKLGAVRLAHQVLDLEDLAQKVRRAFAPAAATKSISLEITVPTALPRVKADPLRLEQILNNLLGNALKFSPEGSRVVLGLKPMHSKVMIWVTDNGPGIPSADLPALFHEYCQASPKSTRGEKGNGLGLAITKRLVEAHGGEIRVESQPGLGTTFTILLPIGDIQ